MDYDFKNAIIVTGIRERVEILKLEKSLFKVSPQIQFEILLLTLANGGRIMLSDVYRNLASTQAIIRQHIRALEQQGFIESTIHGADKRSKQLTLTATGHSIMNRYSDRLSNIMGNDQLPTGI